VLDDDVVLTKFIGPSKPLEGKVIVVSADCGYVKRYFVDLAMSVKKFAPDWCLLLVVFSADQTELRGLLRRHGVEDLVSIVNANPVGHDVNIDSLISARDQSYLRMLCINQYQDNFVLRQVVKLLVRLRVSWRYVLNRKRLKSKLALAMYACGRFVLPEEIFSRCSSVLIVDVDSLVTSDFAGWVAKQSKVGAVRSSNSWSRHLAGIVILPTRVEVQKFFALSRNYFSTEAEFGRIAWGVDQLVLDKVLDDLDAVPLEKAMSFTVSGHSGEAIVSWKGKLKNERI
jgi:hypothetical protein